MDYESQENSQSRYRVLPIIWGAFVVSIIMYAGIAEFVVLSGNDPQSATDMIFYIFLGISVVEVLAIPFVKNHVGRLKWLPSETPDYEEVKRARQEKFVTSHIVAFAIAETPALYGLALALRFHAGKSQFYIFIAIAVIALLINYPSKSKWDALDGTR